MNENFITLPAKARDRLISIALQKGLSENFANIPFHEKIVKKEENTTP